jgi:hypothetical protein
MASGCQLMAAGAFAPLALHRQQQLRNFNTPVGNDACPVSGDASAVPCAARFLVVYHTKPPLVMFTVSFGR